MQLETKVTHILEQYDYDYFNYSGCFDIIARKNDILLLKVLNNIDSFQEEQARNLKILSNNLDASSFLVGAKTRRENLENNIIYERFNIPAVTATTLEHILQSKTPKISRTSNQVCEWNNN